MTVFELMTELSKYPAGMEVRGCWEGINPSIKKVFDECIQVNGKTRQVVLIDVDQQD